MSLVMHVDAARWQQHVDAFLSHTQPGIVPVAKGNGYGFGISTLAAAAAKRDAKTIAVGTYDEATVVAASDFSGDTLVLTPWRPWLPVDVPVIHTVSSVDDLHKLTAAADRPRVALEIMTSMLRHGIDPESLEDATKLLDRVQFEGFALHLPLAGNHLDEARTATQRARSAATSVGLREATMWVSHLSPDDGAALGGDVRLRVGTDLWLGDRGALTAKATVLDTHPVRRGDRFGYRQRRASRDGNIVVVTGGTSHGIALEAPTPATSARQRAVSLAKGGLEATGRALSPFRIAGKQRWFAEPPHMQCSLIWLPASVQAPAVGDEVPVDVRFTTTTFDSVAWDS